MAVTCIPIDQEQIRAEVVMGDTVLARTPFLKGFNISATRNATTTFSVTFEMLSGMVFPLGEHLTIRAGTKGNLQNRFTGIIEQTSARPVFGKPSYSSVYLAGRGVLSALENKKFSRRLKSDGQGLFCLITNGPSNRPQSYYSLDKVIYSGNHTFITDNVNSIFSEKSPLIMYKSSDFPEYGGTVPNVAKSNQGTGGGSTGTGFKVHDHTDEDNGGPAFGVYSVD